MNVTSGSRLGRYEVRGLIGAGGMGEVYRAWDHDLEREVAIKVLRAGDDDADRGRRFIQEAKATSQLHHPNVAHVYEIGSHDGVRFIAMEIVEGETLRQRIARGPMPVADVLDLSTQIAAALGAAHKAGIVHRDIKPENVIVTPDGYAKVLDFGLAKLREIRGADAATLLKTSPGVTMGTLGYMAPEQITAGDVGPPADVFSLGVVLYEMLAGRRPFEGATSTDVISAILTNAAQPIHEIRSDVPPKLDAAIRRSLAKVAGERFGDGSEMFEELRSISRAGTPAVTARSSRDFRYAMALIVIALLVAGGFYAVGEKRKREAKQSIDRAEKLIAERKLAEAYDIAVAAASVLPGDARLRNVFTQTSGTLTVESDPPGATIYVQRMNAPGRIRIGVTPIKDRQLARGEYLVTFEKQSYATAVRPASLFPFYVRGEAFLMPQIVRAKLVEESKVPPGMVFVEGGAYRLQGYLRPSDRLVDLRDFFIDRFEVSNRDFDEFVRAGGYRRRELWKQPFVENGKILSFDEAMARFHDTTGMPGPRSWSGGAPPPGRENHPVTGITWYEAAAFAEWKGKKLPTIYQWEKAARPPLAMAVGNAFPWGVVQAGIDVNERANFRGSGTMPVDSLPFGASPSGALHMAGNASEWCRNVLPPGRAARGGSYEDNGYAFGQAAGFPEFYSAPALGFRCVTAAGGDEGDFALAPEGYVPAFKAVDDRTFAGFRERYEYANDPLNAKVVERIDTPGWTREKILYTVAGKTVPAYLYLPKGFRRPLQVIQFAPAGDVVSGIRTLPHSIEVNLAPIIRSGRAIFSVMLEGFVGRPFPPDYVFDEVNTAEYVDDVTATVTEMRRGLDYLQSRPDLDRSRIALLGISAGSGPGVLIAGLERRYRAAVFVGSGVDKIETEYAPAASRVNFVPQITAPTLMVNGRYDENTPVKSEGEPMYRLLRCERKKLIVFDGPHVPPLQVLVPAVTEWLDHAMGKVEQ